MCVRYLRNMEFFEFTLIAMKTENFTRGKTRFASSPYILTTRKFKFNCDVFEWKIFLLRVGAQMFILLQAFPSSFAFFGNDIDYTNKDFSSPTHSKAFFVGIGALLLFFPFPARKSLKNNFHVDDVSRWPNFRSVFASMAAWLDIVNSIFPHLPFSAADYHLHYSNLSLWWVFIGFGVSMMMMCPSFTILFSIIKVSWLTQVNLFPSILPVNYKFPFTHGKSLNRRSLPPRKKSNVLDGFIPGKETFGRVSGCYELSQNRDTTPAGCVYTENHFFFLSVHAQCFHNIYLLFVVASNMKSTQWSFFVW